MIESYSLLKKGCLHQSLHHNLSRLRISSSVVHWLNTQDLQIQEKVNPLWTAPLLLWWRLPGSAGCTSSCTAAWKQLACVCISLGGKLPHRSSPLSRLWPLRGSRHEALKRKTRSLSWSNVAHVLKIFPNNPESWKHVASQPAGINSEKQGRSEVALYGMSSVLLTKQLQKGSRCSTNPVS